MIDTSVLFPHPRGPPFKSALRVLASRHLTRTIQQGEAAAAVLCVCVCVCGVCGGREAVSVFGGVCVRREARREAACEAESRCRPALSWPLLLTALLLATSVHSLTCPHPPTRSILASSLQASTTLWRMPGRRWTWRSSSLSGGPPTARAAASAASGWWRCWARRGGARRGCCGCCSAHVQGLGTTWCGAGLCRPNIFPSGSKCQGGARALPRHHKPLLPATPPACRRRTTLVDRLELLNKQVVGDCSAVVAEGDAAVVAALRRELPKPQAHLVWGQLGALQEYYEARREGLLQAAAGCCRLQAATRAAV